jgi:drug/metabolite transporter (DMT)-like permease
MISLYPVVTLILSVFILHENFTISKIVGVAVMLFGAYLLGK